MGFGARAHRTLFTVVALGVLVALATSAAGQAAETQNWGRFSDPGVDDLFSRQARALDPAERRKLILQFQKIVLEHAYYMPGLWWSRNVVHWAKVKNYVAPPNHYANQKLQDVWLSED